MVTSENVLWITVTESYGQKNDYPLSQCSGMRVLAFDSDNDMRKEMEEQPFSTEAELERLVHRNPESLLDEKITIIARQPGTRAGSPDLVALDQYANQ